MISPAPDGLNGLAYLGTPYTQYRDGLHPAFVCACKLVGALLRNGIVAYSPIVHMHMVAHYSNLDLVDHEFWMAADLPMMQKADYMIVAQMEGWAKSKGIAAEVEFFERAGKPIWDLDPLTMMLSLRKRKRPPRERYEGVSESEHKRRKNAYLHGEPP
jgi:hypothetical protein